MNTRTTKLRVPVIISLAIRFMAASANADDKPVILKMEPGPDVIVYKLTDAELDFHKSRAIAGNANSGQCLALHYSFIASKDPESLYWMTIAAENGDPTSMQILSIHLAKRTDPRDASRAKFWKDRSDFMSVNYKAQCHPAGLQEKAPSDDKRL